MILVLVSPRHAALPYGQWLPEEAGRLVAVTAVGVTLGQEFADTAPVPDYTDSDAVLAAALDLARRHRPRAVLALAEVDVERAAVLRAELGLPGLGLDSACAYRDKVVMKEYAQAGGIRVPAFAPVHGSADITAFMADHPGRVVIKPRTGSGSCGVHLLDSPDEAVALADTLRSEPYEVEEFVDGDLHHVDAFRIDGVRVAAVASRYTGTGCLAHWGDAPLASLSLDPCDPVHGRLVAETWRLIETLPSPATICAHAEFFVTAGGDIVLCEVAARIGGGPIPVMLRHILGIDPRELFSRAECRLPVDLAAIREHSRTAPRAAFCGIPPRHGRVLQLPEAPPGVHDFALNTFVGDDWNGDRYRLRKSADFLASWIVTDPHASALGDKLAATTEAVSSGFRWQSATTAESTR